MIPVDVMLDVGAEGMCQSASEYVSQLTQTLYTVMEAVKKHQAKACLQQKSNFDVRATQQYYSEGELVCVLNKTKGRGLCPKLQRWFKGPFKIMERITDVMYCVVPLGDGPENVLRFNCLKPYVSSSLDPSGTKEGGDPVIFCSKMGSFLARRSGEVGGRFKLRWKQVESTKSFRRCSTGRSGLQLPLG